MTIIELSGTKVLDFLDQLAGLRLSIFREYPYLYDGLLEDEQRYLAGYANQGVVLLAMEAEQVVGAITGMPLAAESEAFTGPFRAAGLVPEQFYYIGELLLVPACRNLGYGSRLLARLEQTVAQQGRYTDYCLATVARPDDHPLRPAGFVLIERFCRRHGYRLIEGVAAQVSWQEVQGQVCTNRLDFWRKSCPGSEERALQGHFEQAELI